MGAEAVRNFRACSSREIRQSRTCQNLTCRACEVMTKVTQPRSVGDTVGAVTMGITRKL